jgi:glycosyltransferase involved in cell wall biosynthesis
MYRFTIPIRALIHRGAATGNVYIGTTHQMEIAPRSPVLLQRQLGLPAAVITALKMHGCRIVHDLDDLLWAIPDDNPNALSFTSEMLATMDGQLAAADVVTVSTEPLAEALRTRGYEPVVLPNVLDPLDWTVQPRRAVRSKPRIGWYGQRSVHRADLALIEALVRAVIDEADFVFLGDVPNELADLASRVRSFSAVPLPLFPAMLAALDLDLMLAPLAANAFNECKSNLRLLQAGMLGYPVVASDIEPHRALPVTRVAQTPAAWIAAVRDRVHDPGALRREGETLRRAVHAGFLVHDWVDRYLDGWGGRTAVPVHA